MAVGFIKNMKAELKRVVWPTRNQIINNTLLVVVLVVVVAIVVLGVDYLLQFLDGHLWNFISGLIQG